VKDQANRSASEIGANPEPQFSSNLLEYNVTLSDIGDSTAADGVIRQVIVFRQK